MILLLAAIIAAQTLAVPSPSPVEQSFAQGETLDYNLTWLKITGGTARMTISPTGENNASYRITSVAKSSSGFSRIFRVHDAIETTVTRDSFSTVRYLKRLDEDGDKMEELTTIENGVATRTRKKTKKTSVPTPVLDPISVIFHLRRLDLTPGKSYELQLIADGRVYEVHANVVRREKVTTAAGTFDCIRVEPRMVSAGVERQERLFLWYTNDEKKIPVRIRTEVKVGAITASLRGTTAGVTSIDPPLLAEPKPR